MRTTPMPPGPAGVAMATIVSSVENMGTGPPEGGHYVLLFRGRDRDGLHRRVADAFGCYAGDFGNREVDEAPFVRIQGSDVLLGAGRFCFFGKELRHLAQLVVFAAAEIHAVDEQPLVAELFAEGAVHDVLQGLETFAAAREQRFGAVTGKIDPRSIRSRLD